jgi:hypothetical protein
MPQDIFIYTPNATLVRPDEIVGELRRRGRSVSWHYRWLSDRDRPEGWKSGYLTHEDDSTPLLVVETEPVTSSLRDEVLDAYSNTLGGQHRLLMLQAQRRYRVSPERGSDSSLAILLAGLVAQDPEALVLDLGADRAYTRDEFRLAQGHLLRS